MYTGYSSPTHLNSFLSGYFFANRDQPVKEEKPSFHEFHDWVADKFGYFESTSGWAFMIEDQREDKHEALYLFYELLDEYRGIKWQQVANVEFNHEDKTDRTWRGYSRLEKVKGTAQAIPKPMPSKLTIQKMELRETWFQMVAKNRNDETLFLWSSTEIEKVYLRANEIFGIEKGEWKTENGH
jgi:hypothetical protein